MVILRATFCSSLYCNTMRYRGVGNEGPVPFFALGDEKVKSLWEKQNTRLGLIFFTGVLRMITHYSQMPEVAGKVTSAESMIRSLG